MIILLFEKKCRVLRMHKKPEVVIGGPKKRSFYMRSAIPIYFLNIEIFSFLLKSV